MSNLIEEVEIAERKLEVEIKGQKFELNEEEATILNSKLVEFLNTELDWSQFV